MLEVRRGSICLDISGARRSVGTTAAVIEIGHPWPASTPAIIIIWAARATNPPSSLTQGRECTRCETDRSMRACQAGWNSTRSIRLPKGSWVRRRGRFRLASVPQA